VGRKIVFYILVLLNRRIVREQPENSGKYLSHRMYKYDMNKFVLPAVGILLIVAIFAAVMISSKNTGVNITVTDFESCVKAGNPVMKSYPPQCQDGNRTFVEDSCHDGKGNILTISGAKKIAVESECGDRLKTGCSCPSGYKKDGDVCNPLCYYSEPRCLAPSIQCEKAYVCNEGTGTYWINLNITKEGCSPACVVNLETETAEINWRCTGLIPPSNGSMVTCPVDKPEDCIPLYDPVRS